MSRVATVAAALLIVALCAACASAERVGWGPLAHTTIARLADESASANAEVAKRVKAMLNPMTVEEAATWPDDLRAKANSFGCVVGTKIADVLNIKGNAKAAEVCELAETTPKLHFVSTKTTLANCGFDRARDCAEGKCAAGAIEKATKALVNRGALVDEPQRVELRFLIHLVGDIHQPLHVGFESDRGGNNLQGKFMGASTNLHELWDDLLIKEHIKKDFGGDNKKWEAHIKTLMAEHASEWTACDDATAVNCPNKWAEESAQAACQFAYKGADGTAVADGFKLDASYMEHAKKTADTQVAKAAVRLAHTLTKIFEHRPQPGDGANSGISLNSASLMLQASKKK